MAVSRFLENERWLAEAEAAGYKPNTRLNNALKARQAAIDAITPMVEAKEKLTAKIRALETEEQKPIDHAGQGNGIGK